MFFQPSGDAVGFEGNLFTVQSRIFKTGIGAKRTDVEAYSELSNEPKVFADGFVVIADPFLIEGVQAFDQVVDAALGLIAFLLIHEFL